MKKARTKEELLKSETIGAYELFHLTGIPYSTVRLYSDMGLLPFTIAREIKSNNAFKSIGKKRDFRRYDTRATLSRLKEIDRLKEKRRTLTEIRDILSGRGGR